MLYFSRALESSLCDTLPRKSPGRISTGAPFTCKCDELSQSEDSAELLHVESDNGSDILSDLEDERMPQREERELISMLFLYQYI